MRGRDDPLWVWRCGAAGSTLRPSVVRVGGALVCVGGLIELLADLGRIAPPSWTWAYAGISALAGIALLAVAADDEAHTTIYAGTCTCIGREPGGMACPVRGPTVAPVAGLGVALYGVASLLEALRHPGRPPRAIDWRRCAGMGLLGLAWILAVRAGGVRIGGDAELYSVLLIGAGLPLFWSAGGGRLAPVTDREVSDPGMRTVIGLLLTLAGATLVLSTTGLFHQAQRTIAGTAIALAVLALVVGPRWRRTSRLLFEQRATLERAQDRADLADHLHDSVLQTLALIQRRSDDPAEVASLARRQERELRGWLLADPDAADLGASLSGSLRAAAAEIEDAERTRIEVVTVGDAPTHRARSRHSSPRLGRRCSTRSATGRPRSRSSAVWATGR